MNEMEALLAELTARIDSLEETVEELRYAGPVHRNVLEDDDYYTIDLDEFEDLL